jgi:hypothetical protein
MLGLDTKDGDFPKNIFSQVPCLILSYCGQNYFSGLVNLKILRATENASMDAFMQIFDDNPIAKVLEILEISSPSPYDLSNKYVIKHFRARLKRCSQLRELTLRLNIFHDTGHAASFPQSVEKLEFCGSTSCGLLRDLGNWVHLARQPTWLPQLKSICVRFDTTLNKRWLEETQPSTVEMAKLEKRRDDLYRLLEGRKPPVLTIN